ncbi:MAG: tRNA 5-carboxymethoxyuridine methyltransferase [Anaerolineales bacterium]|nr:tRNA 5-carboxymethoxyuridine methyltransferase [Anaerolineales bacterium]
MSEELRKAFEVKAAAWDAYTETPAGRLREELNWRYLVQHLPPADQASRILDAGAGTGGLGIRLAQRGHRIYLLDLAGEMLELAGERAERAGLTDQIECHRGRVEELPDLFAPETFDAVICHTLIEYVPAPATAVKTMAGRLRPGGIFSLAFVNRYADTLRLALSKGQLTAAREALTAGTSPADLFGVPRQTFDSETIRDMLTEAGLDIIAEYGVRIFADYLAGDDWKTDPVAFEALVDLEAAAADRFPYCHIGRYGQIIGIWGDM